jgi:imidazole glycerol-phosphate synthase subunit HisH
MKTISIVDYGLGNLQSISNALSKVGFKYKITSDKEILNDSDGIILPGVGSFDVAMKNIKKKNLDTTIVSLIDDNKPCLATCLGMQLLFEKSSEFGNFKGLGLLKGEVKKLPKINIGWNKLETDIKENKILFDDKFFYFVHLFYVSENTNYAHSHSYIDNFKFCSSILYKKTLATQFHLEKSGKSGLNIIEGFFNGYV